MKAEIARSKNRILSCDNCRRRKVRCDRGKPCSQCVEVSLLCAYRDIPRRKGPKGPSAPVLSSLLVQNGKDTVPRRSRKGYELDIQYSPQIAEYSFSSHSGSPNSVGSSTGTPFHASDANSAEVATCHLPNKRLVSSAELLAHVNVFVKYLYPIMPVFHIDSALLDCTYPENLSACRYTFLVALCAATHMQLKLDTNDSLEDVDTSQFKSSGKGMFLLAEAVRSLHDFDPADKPDLDSLLTSFFLFASYGNLNKQDQAWYYLSQSISFAFNLKLHLEGSYIGIDIKEAELRRRVFWLLFITERAYCLQQKKPIMLRKTIRKPVVFTSENPALTFGFVVLIGIFEKLPPEFYDSVMDEVDQISNIFLVLEIYQSLTTPIPLLDEALETQRTDITITQYWLQSTLWTLFMKARSKNAPSSNLELLPWHAPVSAGKSIMSFLAGVSQKSADAHGIGMEQKLFDVGTCIAHLARNVPPQAANQVACLTVDLKELLWGVLTRLSRIRRCKSYLFPVLFMQSKGVLGLENIPQSINIDLHPPPPPVRLSQEAAMMEVFQDNEDDIGLTIMEPINDAENAILLHCPGQVETGDVQTVR